MIDVEAKLLEVFAAQAAAKRALGQLQEQACAIAQQMARREGALDAWLAAYLDEHGEPFQNAVNKNPDLANRYRKAQGEPGTGCT